MTGMTKWWLEWWQEPVTLQEKHDEQLYAPNHHRPDDLLSEDCDGEVDEDNEHGVEAGDGDKLWALMILFSVTMKDECEDFCQYVALQSPS